MGKMFDEFAKSLAAGQSRRGALKKLALGAAGALGLSVMGREQAEAAEIDDENNPCVKACRQVFGTGRPLLRCLRLSARYCPWGWCALGINSTNGEGGYDICVPVRTS
jgi:hypothetical protein